jgi:nitroimidazol reductase NimA-like FMN-containing flavoprotein (pyridoxamine 5'-phosphate oxidase superfamily)
MRKSEKEIKDRAQIEDILRRAEVLRIALADGGEPYIVSMNFAYDDGRIYLHSAKEGRKIDMIRKNSRTAFFADIGYEFVLGETACGCTARYSSVFGTGCAVIAEDREEIIKGLDLLTKKYVGAPNHSYPERVLAKTAVIRIDIDYMTGKKS